jgi:glucose-1-phosphate cytidylyltransferase
MDTLKDKEILEDMVEQGSMPWRLGRAAQALAPSVKRKVG